MEILTAAELDVLESAIHEAELAAVVVGSECIAEGAGKRESARNVTISGWGRKRKNGEKRR